MSKVEKQVTVNNEEHTYGSDIPDGEQQQNGQNNPYAVKIKRVGKVSCLLYQIIGGVCLAFACWRALLQLFFLVSDHTAAASWIELFLYLILGVVFYLVLRHGMEQRNRLQRADRYFELCDYKAYGQIETLARGIAKSTSFVIKDLKKMIAVGIYPEGHLDDENTRIMLNDLVYQEYLEKKASR